MINEFKGEYFFLSNFYPSPVILKGINFPTAEHAFQAMKAKSENEMYWIAEAPTPAKAKYRGRSIKLRLDWENVKLNEMLTVVETKFSNDELSTKLLETRPKSLIEGNYWHDQFWGDCLCPQHISIPGKNYLGKILIYIRDFRI